MGVSGRVCLFLCLCFWAMNMAGFMFWLDMVMCGLHDCWSSRWVLYMCGCAVRDRLLLSVAHLSQPLAPSSFCHSYQRWVCPQSPQLDYHLGSWCAMLAVSTCVICWMLCLGRTRVPSKSYLCPDCWQWHATADWVTFLNLTALTCSSSLCFKLLPVSPV